MAIDPARIRRRALEAEQSGRPPLDAWQAGAALRTLAVVVEAEPQEEVRRQQVVALIQAS
ncbi:hypothetical protein ACWD48_05820 [Streptomyces sp. NPDC002519]